MKRKIKEYLTLKICLSGMGTEQMLNKYAKRNWKLICSYCCGKWLIMERDKEIEVCEFCKKEKEK